MVDKATIETVINTFYKIISGYKSDSRNWNRLLQLFVPGAGVIPSSVIANNLISSVNDIEIYIQRLKEFLSKNDFFETGYIQHVEIFCDIACVKSTYEARHFLDEPKPYRTGVNLILMAKDDSGWRITSMIWQDNK